MGERGDDLAEENWRGALAPGELVDRARPILLQQPREGAIREEFSVGLASSTIVGLVVCISNSLNWRATHRAGLSVFPVNRHLVAERRDLRGKIAFRFFA